mmetsp:Transcript_1042/g.1256  ORF Transcript_1042/g.1256 Transcript_1042/m.1256 type:complete len:373 (-) Transcript_1042:129-1247(-)|eukprot:CAMPEP_0184016818 /NCGR_PEP_ID=MMETSP0954-20121128/7146_1 /TAXON_ID=627963 /ORGANISM="Aplanochytrium sp, Strain PBS07" /LENGTH=372 /DNA_ID=CAMNT_0026297893 /DNA_START=229 /DNA_END=1347 /DNA_ORIENTATION=+
MSEIEHREGSDQWWCQWKEKLGNDGPLVGTCRFQFSTLSQLSESKQSFHAKFYLTVSFESELLMDRVSESTAWWNPKLLFTNTISEPQIDISVSKNRDENKLTFYYLIEGDFSDTYDLEYFPWDRQELEVSVTTDWDASKVVLVPAVGEDGVSASRLDTDSNAVTLSKFHVDETVRVQLRSNSSGRHSYSQLNATMLLLRRPWAYMFTTWLRTFIVTSLAFSSFAIELGNAPSRDRLSVVVGLLLTLSIGFKKENGLVTWLDYYTIVSFVTLAFILSYHGFGVALVPSEATDRTIFGTLGVIWTVINVAFIGVAIKFRRSSRIRRSKWATADIQDLFKKSRELGAVIPAAASSVLSVIVDGMSDAAATFVQD